VCTLAIGIGATTTIHVWMRAVLFQPLAAVPAQSDLMVIAADHPSDGESTFGFSYPDFLEASQRMAGKAALLAQTERAWSLERESGPIRVWGSFVTRNFFDVLGVQAAHGRTFVASEEGLTPASREVVIGFALWQRAFGGDQAVVGRTVMINGRSLTVVGVAPKGFQGSEGGLQLELFIPVNCVDAHALGASGLSERNNLWLQGMARLAPGVSRQHAENELRTTMKQIEEQNLVSKRGRVAALFPLWRAPGGGAEFIGPALFALAGFALAVLLVASTNVGGMLLARSIERRREIAIRLAVGAGRSRLVTQLLTESAVLSVLAGAAGVAVALFTSGLLRAFIPPVGMPIIIDTHVDVLAVLGAVIIAFAATFIFGLVPALQTTRVDVAGVLKGEGRGIPSSGRTRLRSVLVSAQVALSLLLLICAGLFVQSFRAMQRYSWGFDPSNILLGSVDPSAYGYDLDQQARLCTDVLERVNALPGVVGATIAKRVPLSTGGISSGGFHVDGYQSAPDETPMAFGEVVAPGYFSMLRIPMVSGREFIAADNATSDSVIVVNETVVKRYFVGRNPIGERVYYLGKQRTVVGVARDIALRRVTDRAVAVVFVPTQQVGARHLTIMVRSNQAPGDLAPAVRRAVAAVDPRLPTYDVRTLNEHLALQSMPQRLGGSLAAVFGLVALLLASVGLYGVVAQVVAQRTGELGVRMALGATKTQVVGLVLRRVGWMAGSGFAVGLVAAVAAHGALRSLLFGVVGFSFGTFATATATAVLVLAVLAAGLIPARRAALIDPAVALRCE
jgi:predicted permease